MIAPAPNAFSIWLIVLFSAFSSADSVAGLTSPAPCRLATALPPASFGVILYARTLIYHARAGEVKRLTPVFHPRTGPGRGGRRRGLRR